MSKSMKFDNQLTSIGFSPRQYLIAAKKAAKDNGYDPDALQFANDGVHKLEYNGVKFGRVGYNDRLIYHWLERTGDVPEGTTKRMYTNYRKRARKVMEATDDDNSPASLSFYILW